jgi:hypothetical protein
MIRSLDLAIESWISARLVFIRFIVEDSFGWDSDKPSAATLGSFLFRLGRLLRFWQGGNPSLKVFDQNKATPSALADRKLTIANRLVDRGTTDACSPSSLNDADSDFHKSVPVS